MIYTKNPIENLHRQVKKVLKNKSNSPNQETLTNLVYLTVAEAA